MPDLVWDFRLPRVRSINASGHKFGLAPLGVGWVLWRDKAELPDELVFHVNYLGGNMPDFALNFSRPGGQVIAQYYLLIRLGRDGYRAVQQQAYDVARHLAASLAALGPFDILFDGNPERGIPAVCWTLKPDAERPFSLFDLSDRLRVARLAGGGLHAAARPQAKAVMRALVRHGFHPRHGGPSHRRPAERARLVREAPDGASVRRRRGLVRPAWRCASE